VEGLLSVHDLSERERELHAKLRLDDEERWAVDNWPGNSERDLAFALKALRLLPDATNEEVDHVRRASIVYERSANQAKSERADYLARTYARARAELATPSEFQVEEVDDAPRVKRQHLEFRSLRESLATLGPIEWLVHNHLERQGIGMVWGDSSAYKSFLAVDMGLCVATGTEWHGNAVTQGAVLYVAGEGVRGIARRAAAWGIQHGLEIEDAPFFISRSAGNARDPAFAQTIVEFAREQLTCPLRLVVVDTLHRNFGGGNENESQDISMLFDVLERGVASPLDCVVMLVHHSRKDGDEFRGSSSLQNDVDWEFQMVRRGESSRLISQKMKDAEQPPEMVFKPRKIVIDMDNEIDSLVLEPMSFEDIQEMDEEARVEQVKARSRPGLEASLEQVLKDFVNDPLPPFQSSPPETEEQYPFISTREINSALNEKRREEGRAEVSLQNMNKTLRAFEEIGRLIRKKGDGHGTEAGVWVKDFG